MRALSSFSAPRSLIIAAVLAVPTTFAGCDDDGAITAPEIASVTVQLGTTSATVVQGHHTVVAVQVWCSGGYDGMISLAVRGAPAGVVTDFAPASLSVGSTSSLSITTDASMPVGSYTLTITGRGSGAEDGSATLTVHVIKAPTFELEITPSTLTVVQGQTARAIARVTRDGYPGEVRLTVDRIPSGISATLPNRIVAGASARVIDFQIGSVATPGTYALTVTGEGDGVPDRTVTLTLVILVQPTPYLGLMIPDADAWGFLWVYQGQTEHFEVIVERNGYAGTVELAIDGVPQGVTAKFEPAKLEGSATRTILSFTAERGAPLGEHLLTIVANVDGSMAARKDVFLVIFLPSGS